MTDSRWWTNTPAFSPSEAPRAQLPPCSLTGSAFAFFSLSHFSTAIPVLPGIIFQINCWLLNLYLKESASENANWDSLAGSWPQHHMTTLAARVWKVWPFRWIQGATSWVRLSRSPYHTYIGWPLDQVQNFPVCTKNPPRTMPCQASCWA